MKLNETMSKTGFYVLILTLVLIASQAVLGDNLEIVPLDNFEPSGQSGGPFTPSFKEYQLTNIGPNSLWWGAYKTVDWLDLEPDWGPLASGASATITVSLTPETNLLPEGIYTDTISFTDITNGGEQSRGVTLSIISSGALEVTPAEDFEPSGAPGGPFTPSSKEYQLTNSGDSSIDWQIDKTVNWLDIDVNDGTLDPCEYTMVTVSLNTAAESLAGGVYTDTLIFNDITNDEQQTRGVTLSISIGSVWVNPGIFDVDIVEGCTSTETLTIGNDGIEDLDFMIRTHQVGSSEDSGERIAGVLTAQGEGILPVPTDHDFTVAGETPYKPGELIVRFAAKANGQLCSMGDKNQILSSVGGGNIKRNFNIVPGLSVVTLPAGMTVEEALQQFNGADGILYAQPNYEVKAISTFPDDPRFDDLWGMHNTGQTGGTADADIDAPEAWDISTGSSEIIVAVIDTGVGYTHPDLAANMWVNEAEKNGTPGVDDDGNGYVDDIYGYDFCNYDGDPMDDHYHGTHCAGTIGGIGNNSEGVAGVNWNVRIMALKFLSASGGGWTDDAIKCIEYSTLMGANLSSNSWGGDSYSQGLKDAIDAAGAAGMLFAAAAGNDNEDTDVHPHYPSSYDCESIISVMATDHSDNKAGFSCWGPVSVDLGAPGVDILSCQLGGGYKYASGTSMATPHVAGACALIWSMNPAMSNNEVKDILLSTGDQIPALAGKCVSQGRLNLYQAILETKAPWIEIYPETGIIGPGESNDISVTFDAMELAPGLYEAEIVIISDSLANPIIVPVTMTVTPDDLQVNPSEGFESSGTEGGPFEPECVVYTLTNINGTESVNWTTLNAEDWLQIIPSEGLLGPSEVIDVNVCISANADLLDPNLYTVVLTFRNTDSNSIKPRPVTLTVKPPDCFAEFFEASGSDLSGLMVTFTPDGTIAYYEACRNDRVDEFPTDPNGGTYVGLWDDDFAEVVLANDVNVLFYGESYDRFYIGSNGYITFGDGDTEFDPSLENHFNMPRISGLFADLIPPDDQCISYKEFNDRVVITYQDVPLFGDKDAKSSFQIELFYVDGTIRITWLNIVKTACVAGLSRGRGLPPAFFEQSNLNGYPPCWPLCDFDRDYLVNFNDFAVLAMQWLEGDCGIPYWCGKTDVDFSGTTDIGDLKIFTENWLTETEKWWLWPVSHWKFDEGEGSTVYDSIGNNDGTIYGATWTSGQIGDYALDFDGVDDYVEILNSESIQSICGSGTVSLWFKADTLPAERHYIFSHPDWRNDNRIYINHTGPAMVFYIGSTEIDPSFTLSVEVWYHAAFTWDGSNYFAYINGVEKSTGSYNGLTAVNEDLYLGAYSSNSTEFLDGKIDDVHIYDRVLSAEEVWKLYQEVHSLKAFDPNPMDRARGVDPNTMLNWKPGKEAISHNVYLGTNFDDVNDANEFSDEYKGQQDVNSWDPCGLGLDITYYWRIDEISNSNTYKGDVWSFITRGVVVPNLLGWWEFEAGTGLTAYDSIGNNDGILVNGPIWTTGKIGGALSFDGSTSYVDIPYSSELDIDAQNGITVSAWIKMDAFPEDSDHQSPIFGLYASGGTKNYLFVRNEVNGHKICFDQYLPFRGSLNSINPPELDQWYHVVAVQDASSRALYINGVLDVYDNDPEIYGGFQPNTIRIGAGANQWSDYFLNGIIDEVMLYNKVLSAEEIWELYQRGQN